jgi:flagellar protein FliT
MKHVDTSNSRPLSQPASQGLTMDPQLLRYYEAIERASADMLTAARDGNWDDVLKLEGACVLLISQLKNAAQGDAGAAQDQPPAATLTAEAAKRKSRIMQRILVNDAEIRQLAEPWLQDLDDTLTGRRKAILH